MRGAVLVVVVFLSAAIGLLLITYLTAQQDLLVGGALIVVAVPLMIVSRIQLGGAFSFRPKATTLVTRGIYSKIPHPLFFFLDVALLGVVIAARQRWLVAAWLALAAVHGWAAAREARVLERAFGNSYRQYPGRHLVVTTGRRHPGCAQGPGELSKNLHTLASPSHRADAEWRPPWRSRT